MINARFLARRLIVSCNCIYSIINCVAFDGFKSGAFDHFDDLLLGHFYFAPRFEGVGVGEFAAVGDGAGEVVGTEVEGGLGGGFAGHDPIGLDVVEGV